MRELGDSKATLETELGLPVTMIAYPFGDHNSEVEMQTSSRYQLAFSVSGRLSTDRNIFNIKRIGVGRSLSTLDAFIKRFNQR